MYKKLFLISATLFLLASCGEQSEKVEPLKRGDKNLSCSDIQLEINEADEYKRMAYDKKQLGIKSIVMPLGYIDTYMSADDAIEAANARIQYLNRIYDIKHCDPVNSDPSAPDQADIQRNINAVMQQPQPIGYGAPAPGQQYGAPIYSNYPVQQQPRRY
jgi:hypothetical protein